MAAASVLGYTLKNGIIANDGDGGTAGPMKTANAALDGSGTVNTLLTAGANGATVQSVRFTSSGVNVKSLARIFIDNGTKKVLWGEVKLPATPAIDNADVTAVTVDVPGPGNIVGGGKVLVVLATTVAGGWYCSANYGDW